MGTHAAFAVTYADGRHECVERTADGHDLMYVVAPALLKLGKPDEKPLPFFERELQEPTWGSGLVERGEEREHEPRYYIHLNYVEKYIGLSGVEGPIAPRLLGKVLFLLATRGWDIRWEDDCPLDCPCYAEEMRRELSGDDEDEPIGDDEADLAPHDGSQEEFFRELYRRLAEDGGR